MTYCRNWSHITWKVGSSKDVLPYAFATVVYLINRMPTRVLNNASPYQQLFGQSPNVLKLRVFGSLCFPWLRPYTKNKLDDRSRPCVFVGYSLTQSAYLCLDRAIGTLFTSRHVQFVENSFPYRTAPSQPEKPLPYFQIRHPLLRLLLPFFVLGHSFQLVRPRSQARLFTRLCSCQFLHRPLQIRWTL